MLRAPRTNSHTRGAILALPCEGYGWKAISEKMENYSPSTVENFVKRVLNRTNCGPKLDLRSLALNFLLYHADDPPPPSREKRFPEYGEVANKVVRLATMDKKHEEVPR